MIGPALLVLPFFNWVGNIPGQPADRRWVCLRNGIQGAPLVTRLFLSVLLLL